MLTHVCVCVCIGNQESHFPQQIFPGDWGSRCAVITNMICACTKHCCTWLICCTACLCRDSFVCFCCIITRRITERQAGEQVHRCKKRWWVLFWKHRCCLSLCSHTVWFSLDGSRHVVFVSARLPSCIAAVSFSFFCCWHDYFVEERLKATVVHRLPILKSQKQSNYNWLIIFSQPNAPFNTVIWMLLK